MKFRLMGIVDQDTIDWPEKIAAIIFMQGCNFRCPWCQNVPGIDPKSGMDATTEDVAKHLESLKPIVDSIVLTGGEPALQPKACLEILKVAGGLGLSCAIETNGSNPNALKSFLPHLDFIAIDVKAPLSDSELYTRVIGLTQATDPVGKIKESIKLSVDSKAEVEVRTTVVPTLNDDKRLIERIASEVKEVDCLRLQQFRNRQTLDPSFQKLPMPSRGHLLELARAAKLKSLKNIKIFTVEGGLETV